MKTNTELARAAGIRDSKGCLDRLIELARADEREACAKVCEELHPGLATKRAAEIIRARGNT